MWQTTIPCGFQHGLTSFLSLWMSPLHQAGWGMLGESWHCRKPGREVGLYLVDWDWRSGGGAQHDGAHVWTPGSTLAVLEPEAWREAGREQPASQISTSLSSFLHLPLPPCLSVSFLLSFSSYFPSFFLPPSFFLFLFPSLPSSLLLPISSSPFPSPTPTILLLPSLSFHRH